VSEIRIGWGGYLGTEGERLEFSAALPQTGSTSGPGPAMSRGQ
jgi:hypothetical protein